MYDICIKIHLKCYAHIITKNLATEKYLAGSGVDHENSQQPISFPVAKNLEDRKMVIRKSNSDTH